MANLSPGLLEDYSAQLTHSLQTIIQYLQGGTSVSITNGAPGNVNRAKGEILKIVGSLQTLLTEPKDLIQRLASQTQLVACLKWLGDLQILACIPVHGSVPIGDVADLAGVPENHLYQVVRLTATAGFLFEPQPGHIAHTPLSAPFVTNLSYLDATMFLAGTLVPASLQMATVSRRSSPSGPSTYSAYNLASGSEHSFELTCVTQPKIQRQWSAYRSCVGDLDDSITELLARLNWRSLGSMCVVDTCASSPQTAFALAKKYPALRVIAQITDSPKENKFTDTHDMEVAGSNIIVQKRAHAAVQDVKDAAVYLLRLPSHYSHAHVEAELQAHLGVLKGNTSAKLILAPRLLPAPGSVSWEAEAIARLRGLSGLQLTNESNLELDEIIGIVGRVHDDLGRLVVVNKIHPRDGPTVAVGVKYQAFSDGLCSVGSAISVF
ncbi:O-methyltransferase family protein [Phaeosphaeriaceae sp. PMI808]|nr:O-methyltransferase family protein [Phaeosphaeriaceae sp. PMI808]